MVDMQDSSVFLLCRGKASSERVFLNIFSVTSFDKTFFSSNIFQSLF